MGEKIKKKGRKRGDLNFRIFKKNFFSEFVLRVRELKNEEKNENVA